MNGMAGIALSAGLAFAVCACALRLLLRSRLAHRMLDLPNSRSLHAQATPRVGGLAIAVGVIAVALLLWPQLASAHRSALLAALALALVSSLDDLRGLPPAPRLVAHLAAAAYWAYGAGVPGAWIAVAVLGVAWCANLYNFMDGIDGMAGGMAAFGFGAYAVAFAVGGAFGAAALCAAIAAAALAFLLDNAPPARVFMGDAGSIPLGFLAAVFGIEGARNSAWPPVFPLLVFMPFWMDATLTLMLRLRRGERPWQAHRDHFYQKAVRSGLEHRTIVHRAWALMAFCAASGFAALGRSPSTQGFILAAALVVVAGLAIAVERRFRRNAEA